MIGCGVGPAVRVLMENVATPAVKVPVPMLAPLSRKVTVPVALLGIVAVNTTVVPYVAGLGLPVNTGLTAPFLLTCCKTVFEVRPLKFASPAYTAVIECWPAVSAVVLKLAVPEVATTTPRLVPPSKKVTLPVAVEARVAVNVTFDPKFDGFGADARVRPLAPLPTTWLIAVEVADVKFESPE